MEPRHYELIDRADRHRYEFDFGGEKALLEYIPRPGGVLALIHTEVPPRYEGCGIGQALVRAALEDIRRKGLRIEAHCSFVAHFIRRHPEWQELLATGQSL